MNNKKELSQIIEEKLSSSSSTASTTLSIEDCRDTVRMAAQFFPIDNQYLAPICDKEILSYLFLIQHSLMKGITCKVVERILNRRLKSDQEELKSLKEELNQQKSKKKDSNDNIDKEQEFSEIECTEDMIDQYDFDIERQKKVLCSWQKGNFSQCAEEIKMRVFEYKKGIIFQEEVEKELVRYITSLSDKNVQGIFKKFEDILSISREAKVGYNGHNTRDLSRGNSQQLKMLLHIHPELVIIHIFNIKIVNIINKIVGKSIEISRELEKDIDHSTQDLSREHSIPFKILSSVSTIIAPLSFSYYIFAYTSALAITHISNIKMNNIINKIVDKSIEISSELKEGDDQNIEAVGVNLLGDIILSGSDNLPEYSDSFEVFEEIVSQIVHPIYDILVVIPSFFLFFLRNTSALAITHIYNTYANFQCSGPIRKKVQDIAAELDINYKSYLKKSIEENPSNKLGKPGVQEIANNNQKL